MSVEQQDTPPPTEYSHLEEILRLRQRVADLETHVEALWLLSRFHFRRITGGEDELGPYHEGDE